MHGSARDGKNPMSRRHNENFSDPLNPLDRKPYNALKMTRVCPSSSPNSGPAIMNPFSDVSASRYALPMSVAHVLRPLSSARNITVHKLFKETTPE
jgi:hypothetical protein